MVLVYFCLVSRCDEIFEQAKDKTHPHTHATTKTPTKTPTKTQTTTQTTSAAQMCLKAGMATQVLTAHLLPLGAVLCVREAHRLAVVAAPIAAPIAAPTVGLVAPTFSGPGLHAGVLCVGLRCTSPQLYPRRKLGQHGSGPLRCGCAHIKTRNEVQGNHPHLFGDANSHGGRAAGFARLTPLNESSGHVPAAPRMLPYLPPEV